MSVNNINKEFIFNLFLKFYPDVISQVIEYEIKKLKLEKYYFGRKIDAYARVENREIFIESQLTRSDEQHLTQIKNIIRNVSYTNSTIIWFAESFDFNIIDEVESEIKKRDKNIEFLAIEISRKTIEVLDFFSEIDEFRIIESLHLIYSSCKLEIISRYYRRVKPTEVNDGDIGVKGDITIKQEIMVEILEEIRTQLDYVPNVYRERKLEGNILVLGGGISDVIFAAGVNRYDEIFIELKFHESTKDIFNALYEKQEEIDDYLDYQIDWDLKLYKIYSCYPYARNRDRIIKRQIRILDKLVKCFANFKVEPIRELK